MDLTNDEVLLQYFIVEGANWIRDQQEALLPRSISLRAEMKAKLASHFSTATLDVVRFCMLPSIPNPGFYVELQRRGIPPPLDFTLMDGITYLNTIAIANRFRSQTDFDGLIFHECVHVAQYRLHGVDRFMDQYVRGWADNGRQYAAIPLEREAYQLQAHYAVGGAFSVEKLLADAASQPPSS